MTEFTFARVHCASCDRLLLFCNHSDLLVAAHESDDPICLLPKLPGTAFPSNGLLLQMFCFTRFLARSTVVKAALPTSACHILCGPIMLCMQTTPPLSLAEQAYRACRAMADVMLTRQRSLIRFPPPHTFLLLILCHVSPASCLCLESESAHSANLFLLPLRHH